MRNDRKVVEVRRRVRKSLDLANDAICVNIEPGRVSKSVMLDGIGCAVRFVRSFVRSFESFQERTFIHVILCLFAPFLYFLRIASGVARLGVRVIDIFNEDFKPRKT